MDFPIKKYDLSASFLFFAENNTEFYNESISVLCLLRADGSCQVSCSDFEGSMQPGDIIIWKEPEKFHITCQSRALFLAVFFDYLFFADEFGEDFARLECNSILHPELSYENVYSSLIRLALAHTSNQSDNDFYILHHIYGFFHSLKAEFLIRPADLPVLENLSPKQAGKLGQFISYIRANFQSPLTLQDASEYMSYTPQYLANFLKKSLGCTFNEYLTSVRLERAVIYLKYRNYSAEQIAFLSGFANASSFRKTFEKNLGTSPEQLRLDYKDTISHDSDRVHFISEPDTVRDYLDDSFQNIDRPLAAIENTKALTVSCSVENTTPLRPVWQELINLGSAENFESPAFREHITMIQTDLCFRYGRITNILSLASVYYTDQKRYIFNFSRIFAVLDYLIDLGLRPFLELGDKAGNIYLPTGDTTVRQSATDKALYPQLVSEFVKSCVDHYGFDQVSLWKFELWKRYNNSSMTKLESPANYYRRFETTYTIIKTILPGAQIGAPGFNTFSSLRAFEDTMQYLHKKHLHPDFVTVYIYPYVMPPVLEDESNVPVLLSENPDFFRLRIEEVKKVLARCGMTDLPLYITEFSTHIALNNYFNDSSYQASFLVKQYLENWQQAAAMGYWLASDISSEYPDNTQFLFGGNGIVSQNGIKKSGYHAFYFMSRLGAERIAQGEHYIITHSIDDNYQILLYNYAHFTPDFCAAPYRYEITKYPDRAFAEVHSLQCTLTLAGLTPGTYKITRYTESTEHGSAFQEWRKLDFIKDLNKEEIHYFQSICVPEMYVFRRQTNGTLTLNETVGKNEVLFINIEKSC